MREEKTFRVVVFRFETDASTNYTRYMITKNYMPFFPGNQWFELKSIRKTSTGKEYAKKLVAFLNWLDSRKVTYENATNHHVREFLHELVFGNLADEKVLSLQSSVGYSTLTKYVTVITGFYGWLDDMRQTEMLWKKKSVQANCSFLYGQIYSREYRYLIDGYAARLKSSRDYTKWYDKATKELLCRNFNTLRDEAVLRLTFEGFRIDEVLSVTLDSYDAIEQLVQPTRSKGRANARNGENKLRLVALPKKTCEVIDKYIQTERADAESESGKLSQYLFINLNSGKRQGLPMSYHIKNLSHKQGHNRKENVIVSTEKIRKTGGNNVPLVGEQVFCITGNAIDRKPENGGNGIGYQENVSYTLTGFDRHAVFRRQRVDAFTTDEIAGTQSARQSKDATDLILHTCELMGDRDLPILLIRRLTPLECERLQGFPDGWTDIPGASDSARYKALGNSVAIPCVDFVMKCMADAIRGSD